MALKRKMADGGGKREDAVAVLSHFPAYATINYGSRFMGNGSRLVRSTC